ncbi:MAG TPA: hypothetical protein VFT60_06010, partial [Bryobacteraceae bacterium]|nr:hypothetical protein [Bryobacteraceae bacterium]
MFRRIAALAREVDLRSSERHDLTLELRFSYRFGGMTYVGTGRTRNLGGETVCFEADQRILRKGDVELRIAWPFRLHNICPLELVVQGTLIRTDDAVAVIKIRGYE